MRVLVTGGAGYLGTALTARLARRPDIEHLTVLDNLSRNNHNLFLGHAWRPRAGLRIEFVHGDLLDTRLLESILARIDTLFHLAARVTTPFANDDVHGYDQTNRWGTAELGYLIERGGGRVTRLVNVSSGAVYGDTQAPASPSTPPAPITAYGRSKWEGERMLARLAQDLELCTVRCANVYGYSPSMRFDAMVNRLVFEAHFGGRMTIHGSGRHRRSLVHIDAAARVLEVMGTGALGMGTFNLVERTTSAIEVAEVLQELYPEVEILHIGRHQRLPDMLLADDPRIPAALLEARPLDVVLAELRDRFSF